jgi:hypothetical protein
LAVEEQIIAILQLVGRFSANFREDQVMGKVFS